MGISFESVKRNLPPGLELLPGETIEKIFEKSSSITLYEATVDGGFIECCGNISGEIYNLDVNNEVLLKKKKKKKKKIFFFLA
jgi:hypothetical protein